MRAEQDRSVLFFFNDTATTEIYTLSLHDALPDLERLERRAGLVQKQSSRSPGLVEPRELVHPADCSTSATTWPDRKSTRLNSSHANISYAVFCLKKQ